MADSGRQSEIGGRVVSGSHLDTRQDALSVRRGQRLVGVFEGEKAVKDARARVHADKDNAFDALHVTETR